MLHISRIAGTDVNDRFKFNHSAFDIDPKAGTLLFNEMKGFEFNFYYVRMHGHIYQNVILGQKDVSTDLNPLHIHVNACCW